MRNTILSLSLAMLFSLTGCHADAPKTTVTTQPKASPQPATGKPDYSKQDCDTLPDPAQAQDCRFWKQVEAAKKKHNSTPVVKRSPGSIQQP
jgi:hypothetical protein